MTNRYSVLVCLVSHVLNYYMLWCLDNKHP